MSNALLSSKVVIEEEEPSIRTIEAVQTSIVAAVGITERGPIAEPVLVTSFDEFRDIFGTFTADADLTLAAQGFFDNGGQFLVVVRTVHFTDPADASTKTSAAATLNLLTSATGPTSGTETGSAVEPFNLAPGDDLDIAIDGGGPATATFNATAASRESGNAETFALSNGMTLTVSVDGGPVQTISFLTAEFVAIGAATAEEVAAVINAKITGAQASVTSGGTKVTITSDRKGTGSGINVTGGTANTPLAFTTGNTAGTGNVSNIDAVTVAEVKSIVEAAVTGVTVSNVGGAAKLTSNTTGTSSSVQVQASSTADDELGFDNAVHSGTTGAAVPTLQVDGKTDGTYANDLQIKIEVATDGDSSHFNMTVLDDGLVAEFWPNLSMIDTDSRYAESIVNSGSEASKLIAVTDLDAATTQRPANGTTGPLSGGDDGLSGLVDNDFIGDSAGLTGIRALDQVQEANILIVPAQATAAIQNAMISYCEIVKNMAMFPILGPPPGLSATQIITYFGTTAAVLGLSEFGAAYWPRVEILNPSRTIFGNVDRITVSPEGIIAGVYARTDAATPGGVYNAPAGIEDGQLVGVLGFETDEVLDENKRDLVQPKRINVLTKLQGTPRYIDGAYTLKGDGNFPFVPQRRGAIFIEQSVKNGTQFARWKNNTAALRRTVDRSVTAFLKVQMNNGAFASNDPATAFFVDFSDKLNTVAGVVSGKLLGRVGLAFNTPAVWVIIRFSRDTRALDQELAG